MASGWDPYQSGDNIPLPSLRTQEEADELHQDVAFEETLPHVPDLEYIDSYLAEWLAYEEHNQLARQQDMAPLGLEEAARGLSLSSPTLEDERGFGSQPLPDLNLLPASEGERTGGIDPIPQAPQQPRRSKATSTVAPVENPVMPLEERPGAQRYSLRTRQGPSLAEESSTEGDSGGSFRSGGGKKARTGFAAFGDSVGHAVKVANAQLQGGVAAISNVFPKKRSREERKERAKASNRRAQRAFRERQKVLHEERHASMQNLQHNVAALGTENEELKQQVAELRKTQEELRKGQQKAELHMHLMDDDLRSGPLTISTDATNVKQVSIESLINYGTFELCNVWKEYAAALGELVGGGPQHTETPSATSQNSQNNRDRIALLLREVARLTKEVAFRRSSTFLRFQNTNMETLREEKAPRAHWRSVLGVLDINALQEKELLESRRKTLSRLKQLREQRSRLVQLQVHLLEVIRQNKDIHAKDISMGHQAAYDAVEKLMGNVTAEQELILRAACTFQQAILSAVQLAKFIAYSWPYYPGRMEASSVLAQMCGEPTSARLLRLSQNQ